MEASTIKFKTIQFEFDQTDNGFIAVHQKNENN